MTENYLSKVEPIYKIYQTPYQIWKYFKGKINPNRINTMDLYHFINSIFGKKNIKHIVNNYIGEHLDYEA